MYVHVHDVFLFIDWLVLSPTERNDHKHFLEENYDPEELQLAYDEYFAKYGMFYNRQVYSQQCSPHGAHSLILDPYMACPYEV